MLGTVVLLLSVLLAGRIAWVGYGPPAGPQRTAAQTRFLVAAIDDGAGADMQQLFPEGDFFLTALTASAAARSDLEAARRLRDRLDAPEMVRTFGSGMVPEYGIFQAGWTLMVAVDVAEASGATTDRAEVERRAEVVAAALAGSRTGFLEGYPQQFWPCDTVAAAASLARAAVLLDRPEWIATVRIWRDVVAQRVDPATGLLPHRVDADGDVLDGPRGSSQSIIQSFWPEIDRALDGRVDPAAWERFTTTFLTREAGLVGVREHPHGVAGGGDVDSGPLVLGVSASASAVTLAAARANGDDRLAASLDREAELLGLPVQLGGQRRYALGVVPVGDAFLAWARTRPTGEPVSPDGPQTLWPALIGLALAPGLLASVLMLRRRGSAA